MARKPRKKSRSQIYHVILRGNNRQTIFYENKDRVFCINRIKKYSEELNIDIYSYCLMDNHIHILLGKANPLLSKFIQKLATSYAMYFNRKYERCGHLFQGRFISEPVEDEEYFKTVLRYILQNPYKANCCDFWTYKWSSISQLISSNNVSLINTSFVFTIFNTKKDCLNFLKQKNQDICMEYENQIFLNDFHCLNLIKKILNIQNATDINKIPVANLLPYIQQLKKVGINNTQLSRLLGIPRRIVTSA